MVLDVISSGWQVRFVGDIVRVATCGHVCGAFHAPRFHADADASRFGLSPFSLIRQAGYWVGVRFDEPVGRGDGTVKGKRVFECGKGFGGFVRGKNVAVGDYPERPFDEGDDDDDEDEM